MAMMLGNLYDALVSVKVPGEKTKSAAEEAAGYENLIARVEADLSTLKWMVGTNIGLTLIVLGKLFLASP